MIFENAWTNLMHRNVKKAVNLLTNIWFINYLLVMFNSLVRKISSKMVIIVRTDLKMGPGKIASQCAHAAVSLYASSKSTTRLKLWVYSGQPKIILKANSEEVLKSVYESAKSSNLNACLIYDAGRTQIDKGSLTVLGIGPNESGAIDKLTKDLKLL